MTLAAENAEYVALMQGIESVMSNPGPRDAPVGRIFTHEMFLELRQELAEQVRNNLWMTRFANCREKFPVHKPKAPFHVSDSVFRALGTLTSWSESGAVT